MTRLVSPTHPVRVHKSKKHQWDVTMLLPDGRTEVVDGFDGKRQAEDFAARAPDVVALRMGQGRSAEPARRP